MADVSFLHDVTTTKAIFLWYEANNNKRREYLGVSEIGEPCARKLWYGFRHFKQSSFSGRLLRLFGHGHSEEERLIYDLRRAGIVVHGQQQSLSWAGGHIKGHCDGILPEGCIESSRPHLLEIKTCSDKKFKELLSSGVRKFEPKYWVQAQVYMHGLKLNRCLFLAVNKNTDDLYQERIEHDKEEATGFLARGVDIINSSSAPRRISDNPTWFACKWCDFYDVCHHGAEHARNCRTCQHAMPDTYDGSWKCKNTFGNPCPAYMPFSLPAKPKAAF